MSELTAEQAIEIIKLWAIGTYSDDLISLIRTQSARVAELEQNQEDAILLGNRTLEFLRVEGLHPVDEVSRLRKERDSYMIENGAFQANLISRIAALESAARWRSCKDEPPENHRVVARYQGHDWFPASYDSGIWRDDFGDRIPPPNEWRSIT